MSDYGYDFSFYLLSQLSEKTSVSSEVTWYHHSFLLVFAMMHKCWLSILCGAPLPHPSLEAPRVAHICSQIKCILTVWLYNQSSSPSRLMRTTAFVNPTKSPSRGTVTTFEGPGKPVPPGGSPWGVEIARNVCKMEENESSMVLSCRRTQEPGCFSQWFSSSVIVLEGPSDSTSQPLPRVCALGHTCECTELSIPEETTWGAVPCLHVHPLLSAPTRFDSHVPFRRTALLSCDLIQTQICQNHTSEFPYMPRCGHTGHNFLFICKPLYQCLHRQCQLCQSPSIPPVGSPAPSALQTRGIRVWRLPFVYVPEPLIAVGLLVFPMRWPYEPWEL